jgi:hypothetical protein
LSKIALLQRHFISRHLGFLEKTQQHERQRDGATPEEIKHNAECRAPNTSPYKANPTIQSKGFDLHLTTQTPLHHATSQPAWMLVPLGPRDGLECRGRRGRARGPTRPPEHIARRGLARRGFLALKLLLEVEAIVRLGWRRRRRIVCVTRTPARDG